MRGRHLFVVDAFTAKPFAGNPAGVCVLDAAAAEPWMRHVANELNLSETAFVNREGEAWRLRWFTPTTEVDLCGHATLAAAHVLWEQGLLARDATARFATRSGVLTATREGRLIELDFPRADARPRAAPAALVAALGGARPVRAAENGVDWLVELEDEAALRALRPDLGRVAAAAPHLLIATAPGGTDGVDYAVRCFAPGLGIPEDPVTGSAQCVAGPWWAARLDRDELTGRQVSARGGAFRVRVGPNRVRIAGEAVTVLRSELLVA